MLKVTYGPAERKDGIIDGEGNKSPWYETAKRINWEIQNMGNLLLALASTAVFHTRLSRRARRGSTKAMAD